MSNDDWRAWRRFVFWAVVLGTIWTASDRRNYAERGRSYQPPELADCELTWLGRQCSGVEVDNDNKYAGDSRAEW